MADSPKNLPPQLAAASQGLRQVLVRLGTYAKAQMARVNASPGAAWASPVKTHVQDLDALVVAVREYADAVAESLPPALDWRDNPDPTPGELLAEREADPVYRLGWVRGRNYALGQGPGPSLRPAFARAELLPSELKHIEEFAAKLNAQRTGPAPSPSPTVNEHEPI